MKRTSLDRNLAKQNPDRVFESPFEIVGETLFTMGEKLGTLNRWRQAFLEYEAVRTCCVTPERARVLGQIVNRRGIFTPDRRALETPSH